MQILMATLIAQEGEGNSTRGPAICRTGTFQNQGQSVFNTVPANAMGRFYFKINNQFSWCSATLIQPNVILTALHCVYDCRTRTWASTGTFYHQLFNGAFYQLHEWPLSLLACKYTQRHILTDIGDREALTHTYTKYTSAHKHVPINTPGYCSSRGERGEKHQR